MAEVDRGVEDPVEEQEDDFDVPSLDEPFIQKYLDGRDALIEQEKTQRSGWSHHPRSVGIHS